ncbi:MAG TPA: imidazole glycerol phosphate synthase subunit HisH [Caulobacteraceae bacterium]|nr:imidazole glycerol phosphate synthase subunit HisH [Caulobacteraceae bacterium]
MSRAVLIDYGSGNLRSAEKALLRAAAERADAPEVVTTSDPEIVAKADRLVLPGVGAFAACMGALQAVPGLKDAIEEAVTARGRPFLGICVGMQLMAARGLEFGETPGLGWISGEVRRIEPGDQHLKVPHMGWNALESVTDHPVFAGLEGRDVYFTHSFALYPERGQDAAAWTTHGERFAAAVARDNMAGVQFHPEKSQGVGLKLLGDFLAWRP